MPTSKTPIEEMRLRLLALQKAKEQTRSLHHVLFLLNLSEELTHTHALCNDIDIRIEQLEMLIKKHSQHSQQ
jgi:hypothetical protein